VLRSDGGVACPGLISLVRGAQAVAEQAMLFRQFAETSTRILVNGIPGGVAWAPDGSPFAVLALTVKGGRIVASTCLRIRTGSASLDPTQRVGFFRDILGPLARGIPFGVLFIRIVDGVDLDQPLEAAEGRHVFELHPLR